MRSQRDREEQAVTIGVALSLLAIVLTLVLLLIPSDVQVSGAMFVGVLVVVTGVVAIIGLLETKRR